MATGRIDRSLVGEGAVEWPEPPLPGAPPDPASLIGARTDDELLAALKPPPGHDPDAPVFVLFGSSWCTHCHALLQSFDAARAQYAGGGGGTRAAAAAEQRGGGGSRRWWQGRSKQLDARADRRPPPSPSAPRFVAATVDFMAAAAADVRFTPTVAVYRRGRVVDAWHGADAGKLGDRVWLWAGARRAAVAGAVAAVGAGVGVQDG